MIVVRKKNFHVKKKVYLCIAFLNIKIIKKCQYEKSNFIIVSSSNGIVHQ